jgi:hypothetical protein
MLNQLIQEICHNSLESCQSRKAINKLLLELQHLPGLYKSSHPDYLDALNQTWLWVIKNICEQFKLDVNSIEKRLTTWINSTLKWRIKDLYIKYYKDQKMTDTLDKYVGNEDITTLLEFLADNGITTPARNDLDFLIDEIERQEKENISQKIEDYINNDPEQLLTNCHPKHNPQANCQILSQRLLLKEPPDKMSHLATDLNINNQTLNSHFKRNCLKQLQTIAKQLGYNHEY